MQREVLAYLRARPCQHVSPELVRNPGTRVFTSTITGVTEQDGYSEWVDVEHPWPGFVPLEWIAAAVIGEPVTRAGLESVRRAVKRLAAEGLAELGWWYERVPIGEPRTWIYDGQEHSYQKEGERRRLAARRPLTEAEAAAEAAWRAEQKAKADERYARIVAAATG